jgi:hypothetical protein
MNMNDDYLWDRTGEPDAEVQELEEVLGMLRYQPQPLALPPEMKTAARRRYFPALAIAAAVALLALALGIWLHIQHQRVVPPSQNAGTKNKESRGAIAKASPTPEEPRNEALQQRREKIERRVPLNNKLTLASLPRRKPIAPRDELSPEQRAEAEAAKEQLMFALRVASAKLNLAQRKAVPAPNNTRFQHKVG